MKQKRQCTVECNRPLYRARPNSRIRYGIKKTAFCFIRKKNKLNAVRSCLNRNPFCRQRYDPRFGCGCTLQ